MNIIETDWYWYGTMSKRASTDYIALHHAASIACSAQQVDEWHKSNGWAGIGYHYFVRKDGRIYRGRPEWALGAHVSGMNNCSLGICAEGDYDKEQTMPDSQKSAIIALIKDVKSRYPNAKVVGHRDIGSSDCPGKYYPLDYFKNYNYTEREELTMAQYEELKSMIGSLSENISAIKRDIDRTADRVTKLEQPMIYNYIDNNMPDWAKPTVQKLVDKGILHGDENGLNLDENILRLLVINDRAGLYS